MHPDQLMKYRDLMSTTTSSAAQLNKTIAWSTASMLESDHNHNKPIEHLFLM